MTMCIISLIAGPVRADDLDDLKMEVQMMRQDYETKILNLEARIEELETQKTESSVPTRDYDMAAPAPVVIEPVQAVIEPDPDLKSWDVDYVGRYNADVGNGGLVAENRFGQVTLGGYFDMEYRDFEGSDSTFRQHRWVINLGAQLGERLRFNGELELEYGGPNTATGDGEAKVEQAYADFLINDPINIRAGALLIPFGRYNLYHDSDIQELTDRPLLARDIIPTTWTEAGYGFFGEFDPVIGAYEDLTISYQAYAVNGLDDGFSDTGLRGARGSLKTDNNQNKAVVGRVVLSPLLGHELGMSGYYGKYDSANSNRIAGGGIDWMSVIGPFDLITEYAYFDVEEDPMATVDQPNFLQGAYAQVNYRFWPKFLNNTFMGRGFSSPTFTLISRYDWARIKDDVDSNSGNNNEDRLTFGFNYRPVPSFVFKFEYQINETDNETLEAGNNNGFVTSVAMGF